MTSNSCEEMNKTSKIAIGQPQIGRIKNHIESLSGRNTEILTVYRFFRKAYASPVAHNPRPSRHYMLASSLKTAHRRAQ